METTSNPINNWTGVNTGILLTKFWSCPSVIGLGLFSISVELSTVVFASFGVSAVGGFTTLLVTIPEPLYSGIIRS